MKTCTKCNEVKELTEFPRKRGNDDTRRSECKACKRKYERAHKRDRAAYYRTDQVRARRRKEYVLNRKKVLANNAAWRQTPRGRWLAYTRAAKARGYSWQLTYKAFLSFWQKPCAYCAAAVETIGLDRVDPTKGYSRKNCVPCCTLCNRMKGTLSAKIFVAQAQRISARVS